ncbi:MAG: hypothetical protein S4CHLAM102_12920 [Chlamydiia bacterium]|nr:hypothetical protein [Chlamydiia bacterium]
MGLFKRDHEAISAIRRANLQKSFFLSDVNAMEEKSLVHYRDQTRAFHPINREGFLSRFGIEYTDRLIFSSEKVLDRVIARTVKEKKRFGMDNDWTQALFAEHFYALTPPPVYITWTNPITHFGLFAMKRIPAYTYIGEYTGVVRQRTRFRDKKNDYVFGYSIGPNDTPFIIDAQSSGNYTRFINHSSTPNLTSRWMIIGGVCHIILFSNQAIEKQEQLTYDYGPYYWKKRAQPVDIIERGSFQTK